MVAKSFYHFYHLPRRCPTWIKGLRVLPGFCSLFNSRIEKLVPPNAAGSIASKGNCISALGFQSHTLPYFFDDDWKREDFITCFILSIGATWMIAFRLKPFLQRIDMDDQSICLELCTILITFCPGILLLNQLNLCNAKVCNKVDSPMCFRISKSLKYCCWSKIILHDPNPMPKPNSLHALATLDRSGSRSATCHRWDPDRMI